MKKTFIFLSLIFFTASAFAQLQPRDTLSANIYFQSKVRAAGLNSALIYLADSTQPGYVQKYSQQVILSPQSGSWIIQLAYGLQSRPDIVQITSSSTVNDMEYGLRIGGIFEQFARAAAGIIIQPAADSTITNFKK